MIGISCADGILSVQLTAAFLILLILSVVVVPAGKHFYRHSWIRGAIVLAVFAAAILHYRSETGFRQKYIGQLTDGETVRVYGILDKKEYKNERYRYYLKNSYLFLAGEAVPCNQILLFYDDDSFLIGDYLLVEGELFLFPGATNEGMFDQKNYYLSQKIDFALYPQLSKVNNTLQENALLRLWNLLRENLWILRNHLTRLLISASESFFFRENDAGLLSSMLLGDRSSLDQEVKELYQSAGISHMLAISGLHMSLVGMTFYYFLRKRGIGFAGAGVLTAAWILVYAAVTGNSISTVRAVGMLLVSLLGAWLGRQADLLNSLGIMVICLMWENPFLLHYSGFLFSVTAVIGIALADMISTTAENSRKQKKAGDKIRQAMVTGTVISLTTLPLIAYNYYEIPVYSSVLNMLVSPFLPVLFLSGFIGMLVCLISTTAGSLVLFPASLILRGYELMCRICLLLPRASIICGKPSWYRCLWYYCLWGVGLFLIMRFGRGRRMIRMLLGLCLPILCAATLLSGNMNGLEIDFLDVGQGDGCYLRTERGCNFFIDGGSTSEKQVGTYRIIPFLKSKGIGKIDYWIVSHTDEDHISGLREVLEQDYTVSCLIVSAYIPKDSTWEELRDLAERKQTQILFLREGDCLQAGSASFTCLYPDSIVADREADINNLSLALLYEEDGITALFAGDLPEEEEQYIATELEQLTIYKVNHHGSRYSSCQEFMDCISPRISVVSCAFQNRYGHPSQEAIARIEGTGSMLFYTMRSGEITIKKSKESLTVDTFLKNGE